MPGLRKLVVAMQAGERVMYVKIPRTCKEYINGGFMALLWTFHVLIMLSAMHREYLLRPPPPLILDPAVVDTLCKAALTQS